MRFYAQSGEDRNYNPTYGYYVVATLHRDSEGIGCTNMYESFESDEDWWLDRIRDNLGSDTDYNWSISDNDVNWGNGVTGTVPIPHDTHLYQSDGLGPVVTIPADG